ncbi:MAG: IMP dehydrogenase [Nitrososphaerota archaeon]|jgi:IMP dehydrogenase|nr:IMP dehydrogenase [Nitrososphaerota archaeon]MDG6903566.1 IMP dehydrogenase [Nitrososphaerota archaeon]MDG6924691.1 IMP dehydrogenase [Nitrososphaerota archaeon]MDG6940946.1 IMP dehydrogenase [Nitrososphaerota archaeon]MDG6945083.1 IMP dehydrogenase [Nitrososphaerota archaeon]
MRVGLTFDDVLLVPKFSDVKSRRDADTRTRFSRKITLSIPIVSANMDTVTESSMAIALARLGGIGVIHRFLTIEEQVAEVLKVKRSEGVVIDDPITLGPDRSVSEAQNVIGDRDIGGIVIVDGSRNVLGLLTRRDITLEDDLDRAVKEVMTPRRKLVTARKGVSMEEAKKLLHDHKVEKLPLLDSKGRLAGLITSKDIMKRKQFPNATKDAKGRLRVGAAVGVKGDHMERSRKLLDAGADALVVDIAHGHSAYAIDTLKEIKRELGDVEVVAGNVATARGALDLIRAGADSVKVGVGSGSICVTRVVTGSGVPQLTAIMDSAAGAADSGVPIIGDGGIRNPGDLTKALAAGASSVMVGSLFAGTEESPGPTILREGVRYKLTRGMASLAATVDRRVRETGGSGPKEDELVGEVIEESVPEGVEGLIPYKGRVDEVVRQLVGGLRSGMSYSGAHDLGELRKKSEFMRITSAGYKESLPHDIQRVV